MTADPSALATVAASTPAARATSGSTSRGGSVHLIAGSTGAGKTTYARQLATDIGGIRFSIDDWMQRLFGPDLPTPIDPAWIWPRVARCEAQITQVARQLVAVGVPVILDLGFHDAQHRQRSADAWRRDGYAVRLHWLDTSVTERWQRVQARNLQADRVDSLVISRQMFDFIESRWEPPTVAELDQWDGVRITPLVRGAVG